MTQVIEQIKKATAPLGDEWIEALMSGGSEVVERQFSLGTGEVVLTLSPMGNEVSIIDEDCNERSLPRLKEAIERELPRYDDIRSEADEAERDAAASDYFANNTCFLISSSLWFL